MEITIIVLLGLLAAAVLGGAAWIASAMRVRGGGDSQMLQARYDSLRAELQSSLSSNLRLVNSQLANVSSQVTEQLKNVTMQIHSSTGQINDRMDNATRAVGEVRQSLGELSKATERIYGIGRDIAGLQDLLKAPKLRGGIGEFLLAELLSQCLPSAYYELQYTFQNGSRCDAVIKLDNGIVPIDSKFPLENFRRIFDSPTEEAGKAAKKKFVADCRRHIDAISSTYILPHERTLNFALMYIPAENVYYEMIIKDGDFGDESLLSAYAFSKRVVPVSPNSFYAFLQTVLLGLRGIEISQKAQEMLSHIDGLKKEFDKFMDEVDILGRHINNSKSKYEEVQRKGARFSDKLNGPDEVEAFSSGITQGATKAGEPH